MTRGLEFGGDDFAGLAGGDGEGDQRGRNIQLLEGTGHGVLAADGADAQLHLRPECAQQRGKGLAPALGVLAETLKILLEGQVGVLEGRAGGDQLTHGLHHSQIRAVIGRSGGDEGVIAEGHEGAVVGVLLLHGDFLHHGLNGGELIFSAEGHQHGAGADGGVEPLGQTPLRAGVQVGSHGEEVLGEAAGHGLAVALRLLGGGVHVLGRAVGVQELPADVADFFSVPVHHQTGAFRDHGHGDGVQVLRGGQFEEPRRVLRFHDNGHPLLGFGDGKLGAVQAFILLGNGVQIDFQTVGQLADGHGHAARAKVVAALDETGCCAIAEQALELPLLGGVAFLHLGAAGFYRLLGVSFGGTCRAADAVPAGVAAQQDDHVAGVGALPADIFRGGGGDDRADLHTLGGVAGMVNFIHNAGGKADLVAVGGIASGGGGDDLPLGQLAGDGLGHGSQRVGRAGDAHGAVDVAPPGQGVTDGAADAGSRAAEGFDLRGMVVGLVLKEQQPRLGDAVHGDVHLYRAGVDFLALVQLRELPRGLQVLDGDGREVHQADGLLAASQGIPGFQIVLVGLLQQGVLEGHVVENGAEGGVAAVIGPVGVDHAYFRDGGVAVFLLEIGLAEGDIVQVHGKAVVRDKVRQLVTAQAREAGQGRHLRGDVVADSEGLRHVQRRLPAFHRVNDVFFEFPDVPVRQRTIQGVDLGGADEGTLALRDDLDALGGGIRPLVKLAGQRLHGEDVSARKLNGRRSGIQLRLGEDRLHGVPEQVFRDVFRVVPVEQPDIFQPLHAK